MLNNEKLETISSLDSLKKKDRFEDNLAMNIKDTEFKMIFYKVHAFYNKRSLVMCKDLGNGNSEVLFTLFSNNSTQLIEGLLALNLDYIETEEWLFNKSMELNKNL